MFQSQFLKNYSNSCKIKQTLLNIKQFVLLIFCAIGLLKQQDLTSKILQEFRNNNDKRSIRDQLNQNRLIAISIIYYLDICSLNRFLIIIYFIPNIIPNQLKGFFQLLPFIKQIPPFLSDFINQLVSVCYYMQETVQFRIQPLRILENSQSTWNYEMLKSINKTYSKEIRETLEISSTFKQFMQRHEDKILDSIARKEDLVQYFELIKDQLKQMKNKDEKFRQMFKNCNFQEFINILMLNNKQKTKLATNLKDVRCPIPTIYELQDKCIYDPQVLKDICLNKSSHLIVYLSSKTAQQKEQGKILQKMLSLKQNYLKNHKNKKYLNIFAELNFGEQNVSLADLSYERLENKEDINAQQSRLCLYQLLNLNSLVVLLVTEEDIKNKFLKKSTFIEKASQHNYSLLVLCITQKSQDSDSDSESQNDLDSQIRNQLPSYTNSNLFIEKIVLSDLKINAVYKQIINILSKTERKFTYLNFCQPSVKQELIYYRKIAQQIMKQVIENNWTKKDILPLISLKEKIYLKRQNLSIFDFNNKRRIIEANIAIEKLEKQIGNRPLSNFLELLLPHWHNQTFQTIFFNQLQQWKSNHIKSMTDSQLLLIQQRQKSNMDKTITKQVGQQKNNQLTEKIQQIHNNKNQYDITLEKIINEIVAFNTKNRQQGQTTNLIKEYYLRTLQNNNPINLIDGSSLQFGNQYLYEALLQISKQYRQKKRDIYVVSIVGAQSSAKSTLLKCLFGNNFEIGAGRCTKGVYFGICQVQNMVIVVIDTEGLLSPVGRDEVFDQQIITFVLKFSNLIILNCKGQLSATLRDMLELCMYVINLINKSQQIIDDYPKRLIFVLRDQLKPNNKVQNEMLGTIKDNFLKLKDQFNLHYADYFKIDINDIISLPSAFNEDMNSSNYSLASNIMFGKYIVFLRSLIINCLREQQKHKKRDLQAVFKQGANLWNIIQSCGRDLMHFKQLYLAKQKQRLQTIYYKIQNKQFEKFETKFKDKIKMLETLTMTETLENIKHTKIFVENQLNEIQRQFEEIFNQDCRVSNEQLLKPFKQKIFQFISFLKYSKNEALAEWQRRLQIDLQVQSFQDNIDKQISKIINSDGQQKINQIEILIEQSINEINKNHNQMRKNIESKITMLKNLINQMLNQIHSSQQSRSSLKINSILDCFKQAEKWQKLQQPEEINDQILSNWKQIFDRGSKSYFTDIIGQLRKLYRSLFYGTNKRNNEQIYFKTIINNKINTLTEVVINKGTQYIKKSVRVIVSNVYGLVETYIQILPQNLAKQFKISANELKLNILNIKKILLGKTFLNVIGFCQKQFEKNQTIKAQRNTQKISKKKKLLDSMLNTKNTLQQKLWDIRQTIIEEVCQQSANFHSNKINQDISNIIEKLKINREKFKEQAINRSIKLQHNGKYKWKQCFKFICNQNKFLLELLCEKQQITKHNAFINFRIDQTRKQAQKYLKKQIQSLTDQQIAIRYLREKFYFQIQDSKQVKRSIQQKLFQTMKDKQQAMLDQIFCLLEYTSLLNDQRKIKKILQKKIEHEIIGCQHKCPICSAKCKKSNFHEGDHEVQKDGHLMSAFGGIRYHKSNQPSTGTCFTPPEIQRPVISTGKQYSKQYQNTIQFIKDKYPRWLKHFEDTSQYQTVKNQANQQKIWANVSDMVIKYKFTGMVQNNVFANQKQDQLTEKDLDEQYTNYLGDKICLRDYYKNDHYWMNY